MKKHHVIWFFAGSLLCSASATLAQAPSVKLLPKSQILESGIKPRFVVEITAGDRALHVADFSRRSDLRALLTKIQITENKRPVEVIEYFSDFGIDSKKDHGVLKPHQTVSFEHDGSPKWLEKLKPGRYEASIDLIPEFEASHLYSNVVSFLVVP